MNPADLYARLRSIDEGTDILIVNERALTLKTKDLALLALRFKRDCFEVGTSRRESLPIPSLHFTPFAGCTIHTERRAYLGVSFQNGTGAKMYVPDFDHWGPKELVGDRLEIIAGRANCVGYSLKGYDNLIEMVRPTLRQFYASLPK
ncbi:hypothetical protein HYV86_06055 [Candidatus Woesearchaeota archaeon]|nr:hypothetical protein [Candidatus Woesearchaeota archaeon]